ncbi:General substrate transporter [Mycena indigotica]|uniref:General substrate transporter n=1 Tax=Mycena indigotica TaxID=2126181 RepID=A0A8H6SZP0_9AGAR|nr:General substrate transporter [Mycena indigotica]KAF7306820.1 General substrate transporter [Mycena indigotica]
MPPAYRRLGLVGQPLLYSISIFASLGVFLFGYDQGVMSGIITGPLFIEYFKDPTAGEIGMMVAVLEIGAFITSLAAGRVGDVVGRRGTLFIGALVFTLGGAVQTLTVGFWSMIVGRIISGFGVGLLSTIVPIYQSEISPPNHRGALACMEFTGNIIGYSASVWTDYFCSFINSHMAWRIPLFIQCVIGAILAAGSLIMPESPRWLIDTGKDAEGMEVIADLHGGDPDNLVAVAEFEEIKDKVQEERDSGEARSYAMMWKRYKRRVLLAMSSQAFAQLNGINVISYYAPRVFEEAGWVGRDAILMTGINSIIYILSTLPPWYLVDRWGRRAILLSGAIVMAIALVATGYWMYIDVPQTAKAVVACVIIFNAAFGYSWGPLPWLYPPEIMPLTIRAKGVSLSTATNWAFNFWVGATTPVFQELIEWRLYPMHGFFCVCSFVLVYFLYPETKGVPLEEMDAVFGEDEREERLDNESERASLLAMSSLCDSLIGSVYIRNNHNLLAPLFGFFSPPMWSRRVVWAAVFALVGVVYAQSPTSISLSVSTSSFTSLSVSGSRTVSSVLPTLVNVSVTITPTSASASPTTSPSPSASAGPNTVLATKLDPAFGVLGAILIITGVPSAFFGHKNRWTSFFLIGFYTLSLVCFVLILKFGILTAVNPPSKVLRGMFVLASVVAGIAGGGVSIFFWKAARYFIGGWGGFALALWIQCFHNGGIIRTVAFRWIFYIGCAVVGFVLCTVPKIHYHILLVSTAMVGSSAFMLGVDCFTTAGLKEFYIWNLGFRSLFPKYVNNGIQFPVSQTMQIELGLIGAITLMGIAVQLRVLTVLQRKLHEIAEEQKKRDEAAEVQAAGAFATVLREREEWEKQHPTMSKHGRQESGYSSMPLMKDHDGSSSPVAGEYRSSTFTLVNEGRTRHQSAGSEFLFAPTPDDELARATRNLQSPGALPALDLGLGIKDDVPHNFIAKDDHARSPELDGDLKRKQELEAEIQTIRRSIDALKSETPAPSSSANSRHPSLTSRRTLSIDAGTALLPTPAHSRPPRENDPRARVHSMELSRLTNSRAGASIGRPTSAPLHDDWDTYVQERKLLQPPAGVTPPITPNRIPISPAVTDALNQRKRRESAMGLGEPAAPLADSSEDLPLARIPVAHNRSSSSGQLGPVNILPPRKPIAAPTPQRPAHVRTRTFEELNERHREKMRDLQGPLTNATQENADLEAAKQRWEKAKALEKEAVTRRQAEKAALVERRKEEPSTRRSHDRAASRHSRSLSADKLGAGSKRLSTMKVEDWQRYQQDAAGVPFPDRRRQRDPPS